MRGPPLGLNSRKTLVFCIEEKCELRLSMTKMLFFLVKLMFFSAIK